MESDYCFDQELVSDFFMGSDDDDDALPAFWKVTAMPIL
jgi:hypothetical protein